MGTKGKGKGTVAAAAEELIAGANKHLANVTQVIVAGGSFTPAQVTSKLQSIVNLRDDVETAQAVSAAKVATEKAELPSLRTFMGAFVTFVKAAYGSSPDVLADFGMRPNKVRTPLTVEQKAAATAKRKATREARNTMGSQQKKAVKGDVTGVVVTPVTVSKPVDTVPNGPSTPATTAAGATTGTTPHTA